MRMLIEEAMIKRSSEDSSQEEKIINLTKDIKSLPSNFFGDHKECNPRTDDCKAYTINHLKLLQDNNMLKPIIEALDYLAKHADSLLENQTNNPAERMFSVLNKFIGGKRICFSKSNSYKLRALCAVVQYNTQTVLSKIIEYSNKIVPDIIAKMEARRWAHRISVQKYKTEHDATRFSWAGPDAEYGHVIKDELPKHKYDLQVSKDFVHWLCQRVEPHLAVDGETATTSTVYQVLCTLRFFAVGSYQASIGESLDLAMSQPTVSRVLSNVTRAMIPMEHEFIKFPR
ncbi:hypothetical protein HCN44_000819 [Aphidius gifuensis]|uniref:Uncharacterized protein n=1 Tax=Aphidius gifuensis TaxID=684658 RepID=A0A834XTL6_APHGI|nr:hypothetical protein HCN44_000819 [Aphidius gifuensis]